jgi:urea transport system ATP-binding protein
MMDVITGKTRPDKGTAWFGASNSRLNGPEIALAGSAASSETSMYEQLTVFENLELALAGHKTFWQSLRA